MEKQVNTITLHTLTCIVLPNRIKVIDIRQTVLQAIYSSAYLERKENRKRGVY